MSNILDLPADERHSIYLKRQAALLVRLMKIGRIRRADVLKEISELPESDREAFKSYLNMYREMR